MLAGAVHVVKRLLILQARQVVARSDELHLFHGHEVVIDCDRAALIDICQLVLARRHLIVLRFGRDTELPEFIVQLLHKRGDGGADRAKIVLLELLTLCGLTAEECASREDEVRTGLVIFLSDQEILLLRTDGRMDAFRSLSEELEHPLDLLFERYLRAQERGLLIEGLTGIGDKGSRNAEHFVFDKDGARRIPYGIAAGFKGRTQTTGGETGRIRLSLDQFFARECHQHRAVFAWIDKRIVLLRGNPSQRLEPVRVVCGPMLERPLFHCVRDLVCDIEVEIIPRIDHMLQLLVRWF